MKNTELLAKIAELETRIAALEAAAKNPIAQIAQALSGNQSLGWAKQMAGTITPELASELGIVKACFDPKMPWFQLALADGRTVSVKRTEFALRIRVRRDGEKIGDDIEMSLNAFPGGLAKVIAEVV